MIPFCNNLKAGDVVEDAKSKRRGTVSFQPRETSTKACVHIEGLSGDRYFPIDQLRFVVNGVAEEVPPYDGELPAGAPRAKLARSVTAPAKRTPLDVLLKQRRRLTIQLNAVDEVIFEFIANAGDVPRAGNGHAPKE